MRKKSETDTNCYSKYALVLFCCYLHRDLRWFVHHRRFAAKKSRHRTTIIFLLITGLFSLVCFCIYPAEQMISNYDLVKAPVKINEKVAGMQLAVIERETDGRGKTLKYLGEFITDEGSASQYFNVNLENGKVRCEDFPACEEAIQETFSERKISIANFNGNSLTYQELIEEMNGAGVNEKSTFKASAVKFAVVFLPETVLIMKYILFEFQR